MEKSKNRLDYLNDLDYFIDTIKITDAVLEKLRSHQFFSEYQNRLKKLKNDDKSKLFLLLELTRERATCDAIIGILRQCSQKEAADRLEKYNTSAGQMQLSKDINLNVEKGGRLFYGLSNTYTLFRDPRGLCLIINNVEEQQSPEVYDERGNVFTPKGLRNETLRFANVFKQLHFNVEMKTKLSAQQILEYLNFIKDEESRVNDEAFVLIVISHGQDKQVLGYNACEALRKKNFNQLRSQQDLIEAQQEMRRDTIKIKEMVQIFSEEKCPHLKSKPKLFFFICCRDRDENSDSSQDGVQETAMDPIEFKDPIHKNGKVVNPKNLDTFVSYSCAQGCQSNYDSLCGMSYFGLALTQSIAQYACDEPLGTIMSRTSQRLKAMYEKEKDPSLTIGNFAIQVNNYAMNRQLYFNPGYFDGKR